MKRFFFTISTGICKDSNGTFSSAPVDWDPDPMLVISCIASDSPILYPVKYHTTGLVLSRLYYILGCYLHSQMSINTQLGQYW